MERGKYDAAIRELRAAERLAEQPPVGLLVDLAVCYNIVGEFVAAETYARRSLEAAVDPADEGRALNHLGISLSSQVQLSLLGLETRRPEIQRKLEEAEPTFRRALEITDGQMSIVWYNLAEVLKLGGSTQEAQTAFSEYLERSPDGARAAEARRATDWMACVQAFYPPEGSGGDPSIRLSDVPIDVRGDVVPPVKTHAPVPLFNDRVGSARIQGTVIFEAIIDKNGNVRCLSVLKGLPMGLAEDAARAVSQWKFEPATLNGEPVVVKYYLQIRRRIK